MIKGSLGWTNEAKGVSIGGMRFPCLLVAVGILALAVWFSYAEDLTTLDGKIYVDITDISHYPTQIFFTSNSNRIGVAITNLTEEFQSKHHFAKMQSPATNNPVQQPPNFHQDDIDTVTITNQQTQENDLFLASHIQSELTTQKTISEYPMAGCSHDWTLYLNTREAIFLSSHLVDKFFVEVQAKCHLSELDLMNKAFRKFLEWENVAAKNTTESFQKALLVTDSNETNALQFTFEWNKNESSLEKNDPPNKYGVARLIINSPHFGGHSFTKQDVIHFRAILKSVPELKQELVQSIRNQEAQKTLFK